MKYFADIDTKESEENAFKWLKKSVDTRGAGISSDEYLNPQILLGVCYIEGIGTTPNYDKAFELFSDVAKDYIEIPVYNITLKSMEQEFLKFPNNNPSKYIAKSLIGYCYSEGKGVPQDYQKAFEYFMEAANARDTEAMANVGAYYWQSKGVEKRL